MDTSPLASNSAVAFRLARLNLDVAKGQGDAALSLVESAKEFAEQQGEAAGRVSPAHGVDVEA